MDKKTSRTAIAKTFKALGAILKESPDLETTRWLLERMQKELTKLEQDALTKHGSHAQLRQVQAQVEAWCAGKLEGVAGVPVLDAAQQAELRRLLRETRIDRMVVEETERAQFDSELDIQVGGLSFRSTRCYSYPRERSWADITVGEQRLYGSGDLRFSAEDLDEAQVRAAAQAIPTTLPPEALTLYLVLLAFDGERLLSPWAPWLDEVDFSQWPPVAV